MRSFAVIAGLAASANAAAYAYPGNYSTPVTYGASTPVSVASSTPVAYTTQVITGLTTVCPTPTVLTYAGNTYTVKTSTTLVISDCVTTTSYPVSSAASTPAPAKSTPGAAQTSVVLIPYPSFNGTGYTPPAGTAPPSPTKSSPPQFTGAAAQNGAAFLAVAAGLAALL
ncbi:hypothetical protein ACEQ8H_008322 [Pleosporales sp. CAS-2024a]